MAMLSVDNIAPWDMEGSDVKKPETLEEIEKAAAEAVSDCIDFFDNSYIRVSPLGVVIFIGMRAYLLKPIDILVDRELTTEEIAVVMADDDDGEAA